MSPTQHLLAAYDNQLRTDAETASAANVRRLGPLYLASYPRRGFITYKDLGAADSAGISQLVADAVSHFRGMRGIANVEWKTRAHDHAPGLHDALVAAGFVPSEPESIMIGEARLLAVDERLPTGVTLRQITRDDDIRKMTAMQAAVFGDDESEAMAQSLISRLANNDGMELWVAEAEGQIISAGRLDPVEGTEFAGIWGGSTLARWRGQGVYRALTSARAKSALALGKKWIHSDSTEFSRPILERSGLQKVSETTRYLFRFNLKTAVGRTQVGLNWRVQLGETRQRPLGRNEEQRRCAWQDGLNWVRSVVTQWVSQLEAKNMSKIKCLQRV